VIGSRITWRLELAGQRRVQLGATFAASAISSTTPLASGTTTVDDRCTSAGMKASDGAPSTPTSRLLLEAPTPPAQALRREAVHPSELALRQPARPRTRQRASRDPRVPASTDQLRVESVSRPHVRDSPRIGAIPGGSRGVRSNGRTLTGRVSRGTRTGPPRQVDQRHPPPRVGVGAPRISAALR